MGKYEKKTDKLKFKVIVPSDNELPVRVVVRVVVGKKKFDPRQEYIIRSGVKHVDTDVATAIAHYLEDYLIDKKKVQSKK